jgi:hypothetical protein
VDGRLGIHGPDCGSTRMSSVILFENRESIQSRARLDVEAEIADAGK